jgi:Fic family protein
MQTNDKWIWQHQDYPKFNYNIYDFLPKITLISQNIGQIKALVNLLDEGEQNSIKIDSFTSEIISSSKIEGEKLSRDSVRSSIRKKIQNHLT